MVEHYAAAAPVLVPHLRGHPVTLRRLPDGVEGVHWYETQAPAHPPWIETVTFHVQSTGKVFEVCVLNDTASLVWAAQIAAVELHPFLGTVEALECPRAVVFDLDPGPPATIVDCCRVALLIREVLGDLGLQAWVKTSGSAGIHVHLPLNTPLSYEETKGFARADARLLERRHPQRVTSGMARAGRSGRVFVDWSQNDFAKSTVAPYSLRAASLPTVATPVTWERCHRRRARVTASTSCSWPTPPSPAPKPVTSSLRS